MRVVTSSFSDSGCIILASYFELEELGAVDDPVGCSNFLGTLAKVDWCGKHRRRGWEAQKL